MVEVSSLDDLFEQPILGDQPNATQDLDSGSSDTSDYSSSSDSSSDSDSDLDDSGDSDGSRHSEPKEGVIKAYLTVLRLVLVTRWDLIVNNSLDATSRDNSGFIQDILSLPWIKLQFLLVA